MNDKNREAQSSWWEKYDDSSEESAGISAIVELNAPLPRLSIHRPDYENAHLPTRFSLPSSTESAESVGDTAEAEGAPAASHEDHVRSFLKRLGLEARWLHSSQSFLVRGATPEQLSRISALPSVKNIWPNRTRTPLTSV